jgi:hypothetical protein
MRKSKNTTESNWIDPEDAPTLTAEWFKQADLYEGEILIRSGKQKRYSSAPCKRDR